MCDLTLGASSQNVFITSEWPNKLEGWFLEGLNWLVKRLEVRPKPMQAKHISGAPLQGQLPGLARKYWAKIEQTARNKHSYL